MAPARGQKDSSPAAEVVYAGGRMIGFTLMAGMALAILAAVVLLPAWQRLDTIRARRDALAAKVETNDRLVAYRDRLIIASKTNPRLTEDLLIQQRNCRRPGEVVVPTDIPPDPPVITMLAAKVEGTGSAASEANAALLDRLANRVQRPRTRRGLLLLSGLLMIAAMILFIPPDGRSKRRR